MRCQMSKQKEALIFKSSFDELDDRKDPYVEKLEEININCHSVKTIDFEFCNLSELKDKLLSPHSYEGLVLTSPRCVTAIEKCEVDLEPWKNKKAFVVGEKTADCAFSELGLKSEGQTTGNVANLALYILNQQCSGPLLIPCGDLARDTLCSALTKGKVLIDRIIVYRTIPEPNLESSLKNILKEYKISFIVCFSPSSVNISLPILRQNCVNLSSVEWIAIGPTTESCLLENNLKVGCVSEKPTPESLAKAMKEFLG